MLNVNKDSWHARVYKWWYKQKYGLEHNGTWTNLCPYMRAVMFWSWMRPLFMTKWWSLAVYAAILVEVPRWCGVISYNLKKGILAMYAIEAVWALMLALWWYSAKKYKERKAKKALEPVVYKGASFLDLVKNYSRSAHDRICPEVNFK